MQPAQEPFFRDHILHTTKCRAADPVQSGSIESDCLPREGQIRYRTKRKKALWSPPFAARGYTGASAPLDKPRSGSVSRSQWPASTRSGEFTAVEKRHHHRLGMIYRTRTSRLYDSGADRVSVLLPLLSVTSWVCFFRHERQTKQTQKKTCQFVVNTKKEKKTHLL